MPAPLRFALALGLVATTGSIPLGAQAPVGVLSLSVRHTTLKNTTRPTGDLKALVDSLDVQIATAARLGRTSELRRLYAQAATVLARRPWTPEAEFASSLVARTDRQVADPARRWSMRVEQIYAPAITLDRPLVATATLRQRAEGSAPAAPMRVVKALGTFDAVPRDLRDTPFIIEADLRDVADGTYMVAVELRDSTRTLGTAALTLVVRAGLDAAVARLEAAAAKAPEPVRSDLLFPADRLRHVNLNRIALNTFNPARDLASAESVLVARELAGRFAATLLRR